MGASRAR